MSGEVFQKFHDKRDWQKLIDTDAKKWNHRIMKVTGAKPSKRSIVIWSCNNHPESGMYVFSSDEPKLEDLFAKGKLSKAEIEELLSLYPGEPFYASKMEEYTKIYAKSPRTTCCREKLHSGRTVGGYSLFQKFLNERGKHYRTSYKLLISPNEYKGKHEKCPIKCEVHDEVFYYSMQALNYNTSCPCSKCRVDPKHKNVCVDIVKKRNAGRPGQVIRHASRVKPKYNNICALTNSNVLLQHHHVDGQDFYFETQLDWQNNGISLNATVHRDYHWNFLPNVSVISKEYSKEALDPTDLANEGLLEDGSINPDLSLNGAEVSRYTFLEYLRFLIFDIQKKKSSYVNALNKRIEADYFSSNEEKSNSVVVGQITLKSLEIAISKFSAEYKGENWALAKRNDIPNANNSVLWAKVDHTWL